MHMRHFIGTGEGESVLLTLCGRYTWEHRELTW